MPDFENAEWDDWALELENKVQGICSSSSSKVLWKKFLEAIQSTSNTYIPTKIVSPHSKPFWNDTLSELSRSVRQAKERMSRCQSPRNVQEYNAAKNEFAESLVKAKNDWIKCKLEGLNIADSMAFWKRYKKLWEAVCHI